MNQAGPSWNLQIHHKRLGQIDVDMVPIMAFSTAKLKGKPRMTPEVVRSNYVSLANVV